MTEAETCPLCGALPCDWVDNPHELLSQTKQLPDERALIVKWLRDKSELHRSKYAVSVDPYLVAIANSIEAGEHLK